MAFWERTHRANGFLKADRMILAVEGACAACMPAKYGPLLTHGKAQIYMGGGIQPECLADRPVTGPRQST
eukprot:931685-Pelagomonas_calceolata.AAC.1